MREPDRRPDDFYAFMLDRPAVGLSRLGAVSIVMLILFFAIVSIGRIIGAW